MRRPALFTVGGVWVPATAAGAAGLVGPDGEGAGTAGGAASAALEAGFESSTGGCNSAQALSTLNNSTTPKRRDQRLREVEFILWFRYCGKFWKRRRRAAGLFGSTPAGVAAGSLGLFVFGFCAPGTGGPPADIPVGSGGALIAAPGG